LVPLAFHPVEAFVLMDSVLLDSAKEIKMYRNFEISVFVVT
jgi:hypothetical protein